MNQLSKYAHANAKIRAMLSRLLEPQFFDSLIAARGLRDAVDQLRKTQYARVPEVSEGAPEMHRLEEGLAAFDEELFRKVGSLLPPAEKEFVTLLLERYEVEAVKAALRLWYRKPDDLSGHLPGHTIVRKIDYAGIAGARSFDEAAGLLSKTPYARPLARAKEKFLATDSLFYIEASLDADYYTRLLESVGSFSPGDREIARQIIGIEIDIENINWLIRLKKYYNFALGDMLEWLIPGGARVTRDTVRAGYVTDGTEQVLESVSTGPYEKLKDVSGQGMHLIESFLHGILLARVKRALAGFPFSIGTVMGYLILKRRETRTLISILNGKHLGMRQDAIAALIRI